MKIEHVTKKMEQTIILENVNFSLEKGELVGLIGRNGSGKTTALNVIAEKIHAQRFAAYNRSNFFEDYLAYCTTGSIDEPQEKYF